MGVLWLAVKEIGFSHKTDQRQFVSLPPTHPQSLTSSLQVFWTEVNKNETLFSGNYEGISLVLKFHINRLQEATIYCHGL